MARPKNPDTVTPPATPEEAIKAGLIDVSNIPANREPDTTLAQKLEFAYEVLARKAQVNSEMRDVRELCTLLVNTGSGSREQVAAVLFYLPRKTRKGGEDDETSVAEEAA